MTTSSRLPESRVRALWRRVTAHLGVAALAGLATAVGALLVAGWLLRETRLWQRPSVFPLLLWLLAGGLAALLLWRIGRRLRRWDLHSAASEIERRIGLPRGSVQGAVEPGVERIGISRSLVELHRAWAAGQLQGKSVAELGAALARRARSFALAATLLAAVALSASAALWLGARQSSSDAWAAVLHPVRHLSPRPLPSLRLVGGGEQVRRGHDLPVTIEAAERDSVRLNWQPAGVIPQRRWFAVTHDSARAVVPRVEAPTLVWASALDGAVSDTLRVTPVDPLLLLDAQLTLFFPPHTRRDNEVLTPPWPFLSVPEGTRATLIGSASLSVDRVALRDTADRTIPFAKTGQRRFRSTFPIRPGTWGWDIVGSNGEPLEGDPDSLRFVTHADSAPQVTVVFPGVDTVMNPRMVQQLVVEVSDDYGISQVELVSWRVSAWGERWPDEVEPVALVDSATRASVAPLVDARNRGFLPGDTLHYYIRAYDNAPRPHVGSSREYVLRLPTLDEVRERTVTEARDLVNDAERLAERAREHEESTQALERSTQTQQTPEPERRSGRSRNSVEFKDTEAARQALEHADQLLQDAQRIQEALREMQESIERSGLNDTSVLDRLREIESLYERILTPELEEAIEKLREALVKLDAERIQEAIRELAQGSVDFRQRVEQSLELLKRAALEAEFQTLETEAEELSEAHDQLADAVEESAASPTDSAGTRLDERASDLSQQAEDLSEEVRRFIEELESAGEMAAAELAQLAQQAAGAAAQADRRTAQAMTGQTRQAGESARQAASQMESAASALEEGREQMQRQWRQQVVQALERATTEALELAQRQEELNEQMGSSDPGERSEARSEEVALKRGVDQMTSQLENTARETLLVDPALLDAAGTIGEAMEQLLGQMADGTRSGRTNPALGEHVSESLNELAYRMMQAAEAASNTQSGTGLQEALQELAQLAEQQGQLNVQSGGVNPADMSDLILQRLHELARRQQGIAQELEQLNRSLGPRGQVLGQLDDLAREAEDLARELDRGRLNEQLIDRQNRLFQRLLDAGRTLERDEFDKERRAERPEDVEVLRPGQLPADVLRRTEIAIPGEAELRRYPPAFRRLILEYFDRLNRRGGSGGD
jgi:hypothetical protein